MYGVGQIKKLISEIQRALETILFNSFNAEERHKQGYVPEIT
jgi:hypothetical protein